MPGHRVVSPVQMYHVMDRGVKKYDVFLDSMDRYRFLDLLKRKVKEDSLTIHAYCLMGNHYHLLAEEGNKPLSVVMQGIKTSYARIFNRRHGTVGHVFQGRFISEAISTEIDLMRCARYIHNNPVKAGITARAEDYWWSSYRLYLSDTASKYLTKDTLLHCHSSISQDAVNELRAFTPMENDDKFIDYEDFGLTKDEKIAALRDEIEQFLYKNGLTIPQLHELPVAERNAILKNLKQHTKGSLRMLSTVLGLGKNVIYKA